MYLTSILKNSNKLLILFQYYNFILVVINAILTYRRAIAVDKLVHFISFICFLKIEQLLYSQIIFSFSIEDVEYYSVLS